MGVEEEAGKVETVKSTFKWLIPSDWFNACKCVRDKLKSPVFVTMGDPAISWRLGLYPRGKHESTRDFMAVTLATIDADSDVIARFACYLFHDNKQVSTFNYGFQPHLFKPHIEQGEPRFLNRKFILDNRLLEDDLMIYCEITVDLESGKILENNDDLKMKPLIYRKLKELDSLEYLLDNESFTDVTLLVKDQAFNVHRNILATKSTVFATLFQQYQIQNPAPANAVPEIPRIRIQDTSIEPHVFKEVLRFAYAGKVKNLDDLAGSLLAASHKFALPRLKTMCEENIFENISIHNAVRCLRMADNCEAPNLKKLVLDFIAANAEQMLNVPEYQVLSQELPPHLVYDVLRTLTMSHCAAMT